MKNIKDFTADVSSFNDIIKLFDKKDFDCKQISMIKYFWRTERLLTVKDTLNLLDEVQIKAIFWRKDL